MTISRKVKTLGLGALAAMLLAVLGAFLAANYASADAGNIAVNNPSPSVNQGANFKITITTNADVALTGAQTDFSFDPAKVHVVSVTQGPDWTGAALIAGVFPQTVADAIAEANTTGTLKGLTVVFNPGAGSVSANTNHMLVSITLAAQAAPGGCGDSPLSLKGIIEMNGLAGISVTPTPTSSSVTVKCLTPTATFSPTPTSTPGPTPTPSPTPAVEPSTGQVAVNGSVPGGTLAITVPSNVVVPLERGVINTADGKVSIAANIPWSLGVTDPKSPNTGFMTDDGPPLKKLANSMKVAVGPTQVNLIFGGKLTAGAGDSSVGFQLRQQIVPADLPGNYHIDVLFQAVATF